MASKRTSYDDDDSSTKRIRHDDDNDNQEEQQHPLYCGGLTVNNPSGRKCLKFLYFPKNLPKRNYTQSRIKAEGGEPLRIELRDTENLHIVRDVGSLMKIQICVLYGDFEKEDSTAEEFDKQIVIPRRGKEPLLKGDTVITLKDGVAFINNLEFTDISKRRTEEFRLGAKIVRSNSIGLDIREGRSEPFRVLNVRGKAYQKHDRPSLNDELWRLRGIRKDGKFQEKLAAHGIISVKDFLQLYKTNEASLKEMLGKIPKKSWLAIIEHAKSCVVNDYKLYSYVANGQQIALIFNAIYELVGVTNDAQNYYLPETLIPSLKNIVEKAKQDAYKNVDNNLVPIDEAQLNSTSLAACLKSAAQSDAPAQGLQHIDISTAQGQKETGPSYVQPCTSTSYANQGMNNCQINVDNSVPNITEIPQNNDVECEMCSEDILNFINNAPFDFSDVVECSTSVNFVNSGTDISNNGKPKAVWWCKIRAVIKWGISVRKVAAAKRNY